MSTNTQEELVLSDFEREELERAQNSNDMNTFLYAILSVLDGWDGIMLPEDLQENIVRLTGSCPYSLEELERWLSEEE